MISAALVLGVIVTPETWAQTAKGKKAPPAGAVENDEITVTAQKREESIQEIPVSVTAISGEALRERGVTDVRALGEVAPNVRISTYPATQSGTTISIRGAGQGNPNPVFQPAAALYVDGVYISGIQGSNLDLVDLERVEVLRGPQGTLFGRNTVAGLANFITKKPTEVRSITLQTEAGNFDTFEGRVTANVPLIGKNGFFQSDALGTISLRETAGYKTHEGYFRNALPPGAPAQPTTGGGADYNDLNRVYNFTAVRWQPRKDITVDYAFKYHRYRNHQSAFQLTYIYPGSIADSSYRLPNGAVLIDDVIAGIDKGHIARQGIVMVADKEARDGAHVVHGHEAVSSPSGR